MSSPEPVRQPDEEPVPKKEEVGATPQPPPGGRFAGIGNGRVLVVSDSLDEVVRRLDEAGADRQHVEIWEVARDADRVGYVWSCRQCPPEQSGGFPGRTLFRDNPVMQRNEQLARQISEEARSNPTP